MSWRATGEVKKLRAVDGVTRSEKLVLMCLADYHNDESGRCDPSVPRLAEESLLEERHLRRVLASLDRKGFIRTEHRPGRRSQYWLTCVDKSTPDIVTGVARREKSGAPRTFQTPKSPDTPDILSKTPDVKCPPNQEPKETVKEPPDQPPWVAGPGEMAARPWIYMAYEEFFGLMTHPIAVELIAMNETYPEAWIKDAFDVAKRERARAPVKYIKAILSRWAQDGRAVEEAPTTARAQFMQRYHAVSARER